MRRSLLVVVPLLVLGAVVTLRWASAQAGQGALPPAFHVVADVPLTGGTARFDYQSLDAQAHRLYIAHLGASQVIVFDTQSGTRFQTVLVSRSAAGGAHNIWRNSAKSPAGRGRSGRSPTQDGTESKRDGFSDQLSSTLAIWTIEAGRGSSSPL